MAFKLPTRTQREPATHRGNSRLSPSYRAVARSTRPHRSPRHRRVSHRWFTTPCGSGTASHRFRCTPRYTGPYQNGSGGKSGLAPDDGFRAEPTAQPPPEDGGMRSSLYQSAFGGMLQGPVELTVIVLWPEPLDTCSDSPIRPHAVVRSIRNRPTIISIRPFVFESHLLATTACVGYTRACHRIRLIA
jgi:hypothetical protein